MKRIVSFLLSCILLMTMALTWTGAAQAASDMQVSDELVKILKIEEGFVKYPVWDYSQYTVGYGTRCPSDMLSYYKANGITESEAELLLRNYLHNIEKTVNTKLIDKFKLTLNQGQFDAIVSFSYNMGTGWITNANQNIHDKIVSGAVGNELIDAFSRWCKAGGAVNSYLLRRRLSEANMYLNGVYSRSAPSHYAYVLYNGNGGSLSQSVQGYDTTDPIAPSCVATYSDYTFLGWYTEQVGGTKVETLTADNHRMVLYAHWQELENENPEEQMEPVKVTVTTDNVNLRKGPGTNYSIVGSADTGDTFQIVQVAENGGYVWGQFDGGWLALQYTDYVPAVQEPEVTEPETTEPDATEPETTEPEVTEPETTVPETTVPETTEPEVTEPETTVPETTVPETTEPETTVPTTTAPPQSNSVIGIVQANPYLCVRKGPGTGYVTVDTLRTGEKVEITEQKTVGSMLWGKVSTGWISMTYVKVEETEEPEIDTGVTENQTTSKGQTGKVTCSTLNIRSGAGVTYGVVGNYKKNATITILEQKTVGSTTWGKTSKGWVSMDYVSLQSGSTGNGNQTTESETTKPPVTTTVKKGKVISEDVLRIRSGAGTSYTIVGFLDPNETVTVTETKQVGSTTWGKVEKGWVSMDYIRMENTPEPEPEKKPEYSVVKTVSVSCLCIRSGASTEDSIVGYLYKGAKVTVTEIVTGGETTWGKIAQGWICLAYTK